jgi:hypothetical protein
MGPHHNARIRRCAMGCDAALLASDAASGLRREGRVRSTSTAHDRFQIAYRRLAPCPAPPSPDDYDCLSTPRDHPSVKARWGARGPSPSDRVPRQPQSDSGHRGISASDCELLTPLTDPDVGVRLGSEVGYLNGRAWNPGLVEQCARVRAGQVASWGVAVRVIAVEITICNGADTDAFRDTAAHAVRTLNHLFT